MHDARCISFRQSFGRVLQVTQKLFQVSSRLVDFLAQRLAVNELHRDKVSAGALSNLVHVSDVRMIERRGRLRFPNETFHPIAIRCDVDRKYLERYFAIELGVLRQIHLAHPARANFGADFVATEFCGGSDSHLMRLKLLAYELRSDPYS